MSEINTTINWLNRYTIQTLLEAHGMAVYDDESTDLLRETLREDVLSGEIGEWEVQTALDEQTG